MNAFRPTLRRIGLALTLATSVMLVAACFVVGTHHHDGGSTHTCAVCSTGHSPAAPAHVVPRVAPVLEQQDPGHPAPIVRGSQTESDAARARGPPLSA